MNKKLKYGLWLVIVLFVGYNSVYFKKLDSMKASSAGNFNAAAYAKTYVYNKLPAIAGKAVSVDQLLSGLAANPQKTFDTYSNALDIGSVRFFWVKGSGTVTKIDDTYIYLLTDSAHTLVKIATEFVFGNALRDASGLVHINDFGSTTDLNNISAEINKLIRNEVIPPLKAKAKKGDHLTFTGAIELNSSHPDVSNLEIMPASLKIIP